MKKSILKKIKYETFDYHSINPKDYNELKIKDKDLINSLLNNKSLFVFAIKFLCTKDIGMWEYYSLPNDDSEDFKYEVYFNNQISEHRKSISSGKEVCDILYGISKIDLKFYLDNFEFFNSLERVYLLITKEEDILSIDNRINEIMNGIINTTSNLNDILAINYFEKLKFENENDNCILISMEDDGEFREILISYQY